MLISFFSQSFLKNHVLGGNYSVIKTFFGSSSFFGVSSKFCSLDVAFSIIYVIPKNQFT